jgi:hypothetical protein
MHIPDKRQPPAGATAAATAASVFGVLASIICGDTSFVTQKKIQFFGGHETHFHTLRAHTQITHSITNTHKKQTHEKGKNLHVSSCGRRNLFM